VACLPKCHTTPARSVAFQSLQWFSDPSILRSPSNASTQQESLTNPNFFNVRAILTPTSEVVVKINDDLLWQLPGEVLTFHGDDSGNVNDPGHEEVTGRRWRRRLTSFCSPSQDRCSGDAVSKSRFTSWPLQRYPDDSTSRVHPMRLNGGSFDGEKRLIYRTKLTSNETDEFGHLLSIRER